MDKPIETGFEKHYIAVQNYNVPKSSQVETMDMTREEAEACAKVLNNVFESNKPTE